MDPSLGTGIDIFVTLDRTTAEGALVMGVVVANKKSKENSATVALTITNLYVAHPSRTVADNFFVNFTDPKLAKNL